MIDVCVKVSFGGPRDDRYFDITFLNLIEMQMHILKQFARLQAEPPSYVIYYVLKVSGELFCELHRDHVLLFTPVGALPLAPDGVAFQMCWNIPDKYLNVI